MSAILDLSQTRLIQSLPKQLPNLVCGNGLGRGWGGVYRVDATIEILAAWPELGVRLCRLQQHQL